MCLLRLFKQPFSSQQKDVMSNVMKQETQFFESTQPGEILTQMGASASLVKVLCCCCLSGPLLCHILIQAYHSVSPMHFCCCPSHLTGFANCECPCTWGGGGWHKASVPGGGGGGTVVPGRCRSARGAAEGPCGVGRTAIEGAGPFPPPSQQSLRPCTVFSCAVVPRYCRTGDHFPTVIACCHRWGENLMPKSDIFVEISSK